MRIKSGRKGEPIATMSETVRELERSWAVVGGNETVGQMDSQTDGQTELEHDGISENRAIGGVVRAWREL